MGKFNIPGSTGATVAPIPVQSQEDIADAVPRQPVETPDVAPSLVDSPLMKSLQGQGFDVAPVTAPEEVVEMTPEQQQAIERIPALSERMKPAQPAAQADPEFNVDDPFEAAVDRGVKLGERFAKEGADLIPHRENRPEVREDLLQGRTPEAYGQDIRAQELFLSPRVMNAAVQDPVTGKAEVSPDFFPVMSLVTENFFRTSGNPDGVTVEGGEVDFDIEAQERAEDQPLVDKAEKIKVTRAKGNKKLGQQIWREWQRELSARNGEPTDSYLAREGQVSPKEYEAIGGLAKELYARTNPDLMNRAIEDGQVVYWPTADGLRDMEDSHNAMSQPFRSQEIVPLHVPSATNQHQFEGRTLTRKETTVVGKQEQGGMKVIEEAKSNLSKMQRIVDTRREGMTYVLGITALLDYQAGDSALADVFKIGNEKLDSLNAKKADLDQDPEKTQQEKDAFNPQKIFTMEQQKFIESLNTVSRYASKVNYNTFYTIMLNGRLGMQQNKFNPQANKVVRFATGSGNHVEIDPRSSSPENMFFKEVAMNFLYKGSFGDAKVKGKHLKPAARIQEFNKMYASGRLDGFIEMGNEILGAVPGGQQLLDIRQQVQQIGLQGGSLNMPPALQEVSLAIKPETRKEILKHGDEAPYFMEFLTVLADWDRAHKAGGKFRTNFEAEMDGITHGPSSNALALGSEKMALRSGTLNPDNRFKLLDNDNQLGDLRDGMRSYMEENAYTSAETTFGHDKAKPLSLILKRAVRDRENYLKKSPMTLGYGQQLENLKQHVEAAMIEGPEARNIKRLMKAGGVDRDTVLEYLHGILVDSINVEMDPDALEVANLLRANATVASMTDKVMKYQNPMGFVSYIGGRARDTEAESQTEFKIGSASPDLPSSATITHYQDRPSGAAARPGREAGSYGFGRVIPAVVQAYDGNMISRTASGTSHKRIQSSLRSKGYEASWTPIFDAAKVDMAHGPVLREEMNRNWYNGIRDDKYNYIDQLLGDNSIHSQEFKEWWGDLNQKIAEGDRPVDVGPNSPYRVFGEWASDSREFGGKSGWSQMIQLVRATAELENQKPISEDKANQLVAGILGGAYKKGKIQTELKPSQIKHIAEQYLVAIRLKGRNSNMRTRVSKKRNDLFNSIDVRDILQVDLG